MIVNKLQHDQKIIQYNSRLFQVKGWRLTEKRHLALKENAWFAGFFLSDGSFQIKIIERENRKQAEVRVVIQIDQKSADLLLQIKNEFGGSVGFRKTQDTYYYSSVSFTSAEKIINYFDKFHLMGVKLTQYVLWRKVFLKVQQNFHLTQVGIKWIKTVKKRMSKLSLPCALTGSR